MATQRSHVRAFLIVTCAVIVVLVALFAVSPRGNAGAADTVSGRAALAGAPSGFIGLAPQTSLDAADLRLTARAEVDTIRVPLNWFGVEPSDPQFSERDWSALDHVVTLAARENVRVVPFVWGSPQWVEDAPNIEPVSPVGDLRSWQRFLKRAVERYGPSGLFWFENPELPEQPIRTWQIWNEPNIVTFSRRPDPKRYGRLLRASGRAIRFVDPGARVIMAGLFGRPLEIPPNIAPARFLAGVLTIKGAKQEIDAIGLHPYLAVASALPSKVRALRSVLAKYGASSTDLWITELGWGSDDFESRWEKGLQGQAEQIDESLGMLTRNRNRWQIGRVYWFSNIDNDEACQFCDSAGLLTEDFEAKPSWYAFNDWTGGDADAVGDFRQAKARSAPSE